jgi:hypothetical protein
MDVGPQKIAQGIVHQALALEPAAVGEGFGDDQKAKMAFALWASARMAGMAGGIVDQLEPLRPKPGQPRAHLVRDPHGRRLARSAVAMAGNLRILTFLAACTRTIALRSKELSLCTQIA